MKKLSSGAKMMVLLMALRTIVDLFEDSYITTMLSRLTNGDTVKIALYFIVKYLFTGLGAILIGKWVKSRYLTVLRLGIIADLIFFIAFINMNNTWTSLVTTAILQGLALILYYLPVSFANSNWIKQKERHLYSSINGISVQILGILIPITFGGIIAKTSYTSTGSIIVAIILLQLFATLFVKNEKTSSEKKFALTQFCKDILHSKQMKLFILMNLFRGIALMGAQRQLINMLIFNQYQNEFQLGKITSIISFTTIILLWLFGKFTSTNHYRKLLILTTSIQILSVVSLILTTNTATIITISFCFTSCVGIINIILDNFFYTIANQYNDSKPEFLVSNEIVINAGRIISWCFAIFTTLFQTSSTITISISLINLAFIGMSAISAHILKKAF